MYRRNEDTEYLLHIERQKLPNIERRGGREQNKGEVKYGKTPIWEPQEIKQSRPNFLQNADMLQWPWTQDKAKKQKVWRPVKKPS